jgi:NAD(P)H-hydrate epimerase
MVRGQGGAWPRPISSRALGSQPTPESILQMKSINYEIPFLTADSMREVDRLMTEELGIGLLQMMENAGRALAWLCLTRFLSGDVRSKEIVVLAGGGANGGGAMACARRLRVWGASVLVLIDKPKESQTGAAAQQLSALQRLGLLPGEEGPLSRSMRADVIIDGLIGYGLRGSPAGRTGDLIRSANKHPAPVLALDVPSGIDATTGEVHMPVVEAAATLSLALPKTGLQTEEARRYVGELYLADIGVPLELYQRRPIGVEVPPIFAQGDVIRIW